MICESLFFFFKHKTAYYMRIIDWSSDVCSSDLTLLDWKVIFFRDQNITTEQHIAFARNFGELEVHPFAPHKPDYPEILAITHDKDNKGKENLWHSDVTWREAPRSEERRVGKRACKYV